MTGLRNHILQSPHRNQLELLLRKTLPALRGKILEVGSKNRRYDRLYAQPPTAIDIVENKECNVMAGNVVNIPFPGGSFDAVVCLEVLEYVDDPKRAMHEMHRVLKSGGSLVVSVPFLHKEHGDKLRYTSAYLRELLSGFAVEQLRAVGGSWTVACTMLWSKLYNIRFSPLRYVLLALYLPLRLFRGQPATTAYASGYFIVAKKQL